MRMWRKINYKYTVIRVCYTMLRGGGMPYFHSRQGNKTLMNHIIAITCSGCWNIYTYWGSVEIYALAVAKDKTEIISTQTYELTWRERMVRTNRIAPTTRYFSLLCVSNKILSITLLSRKLHLQGAKRKQLNFQMINNIKVNSDFCKATRKYFIRYGWCRTQKHSSSHMFNRISGFVPLWFWSPLSGSTNLLLPLATFSGGHEAVITLTSWHKCFS